MITNQLLYHLSYVGLRTYTATDRHELPLPPQQRHEESAAQRAEYHERCGVQS